MTVTFLCVKLNAATAAAVYYNIGQRQIPTPANGAHAKFLFCLVSRCVLEFIFGHKLYGSTQNSAWDRQHPYTSTTCDRCCWVLFFFIINTIFSCYFIVVVVNFVVAVDEPFFLFLCLKESFALHHILLHKMHAARF